MGLVTRAFCWLILSTASLGYAQEPGALLGREAWSAFSCAALAGVMEQDEKQERLFSLGLRSGRAFLQGIQDGVITSDDVRKSVPLMVTLLLSGPSHDFILGRIYSSAEDYILDDVFVTGGQYNPDELQKSIAKNKYRDRNCEILGR